MTKGEANHNILFWHTPAGLLIQIHWYLCTAAFLSVLVHVYLDFCTHICKCGNDWQELSVSWGRYFEYHLKFSLNTSDEQWNMNFSHSFLSELYIILWSLTNRPWDPDLALWCYSQFTLRWGFSCWEFQTVQKWFISDWSFRITYFTDIVCLDHTVFKMHCFSILLNE